MNLMARIKSEVFAVEPNYANEMLRGLERLQADRASGIKHDAIATEGVTYQETGNVAIVAVDGVMYKKDISGMCQSVASYDKIVSAIDAAENNDAIDTILFRVDTNGGSVAGADEVRSRIKNSPKKTILYAENLLASAGMWIFSAADEIYSNDMTHLGSIGVIVVYEASQGDKKVNAIVSSNAPNKYCDINDEKCKAKIQSRIDEYEAKFFERMTESFGKSKEQIIEDFNAGSTIFADVAMKKGYVNGLMTFSALLENLAVMPSNEKITNSTQGVGMSAESTVTVESIEGNENAVNDALQKEQERVQAVLAAVVSAGMTDNADIMAMVTDGKSTVTDVKAKMFDMVQAVEKKVIATVTDNSIAEKIDEIDGAAQSPKQEDITEKEADAYLAFAEQHKGSIQ